VTNQRPYLIPLVPGVSLHGHKKPLYPLSYDPMISTA
jgi:hypothetical protein